MANLENMSTTNSKVLKHHTDLPKYFPLTLLFSLLCFLSVCFPCVSLYIFQLLALTCTHARNHTKPFPFLLFYTTLHTYTQQNDIVFLLYCVSYFLFNATMKRH